MSAPAPIEPSANVLGWRYAWRLLQDEAAFERHVDRYLRVQTRAARAEKRAAIAANRAKRAPRTPRPPA